MQAVLTGERADGLPARRAVPALLLRRRHLRRRESRSLKLIAAPADLIANIDVLLGPRISTCCTSTSRSCPASAGRRCGTPAARWWRRFTPIPSDAAVLGHAAAAAPAVRLARRGDRLVARPCATPRRSRSPAPTGSSRRASTCERFRAGERAGSPARSACCSAPAWSRAQGARRAAARARATRRPRRRASSSTSAAATSRSGATRAWCRPPSQGRVRFHGRLPQRPCRRAATGAPTCSARRPSAPRPPASRCSRPWPPARPSSPRGSRLRRSRAERRHRVCWCRRATCPAARGALSAPPRRPRAAAPACHDALRAVAPLRLGARDRRDRGRLRRGGRGGGGTRCRAAAASSASCSPTSTSTRTTARTA